MLLGQEGEAFFLRQAFEDEATESIENNSNGMRPAIVNSASGSANAPSEANEESKKQKGPKSGHDATEYKNAKGMLEDLEIDHNPKRQRNKSSPKSAHHAMGLEADAYYDNSLDGDGQSPQK